MNVRQVVLDTETTGLNAGSGDRIIEIGCVEIVNRRFTGRTYHTYLNPEREINPDATAVHGFKLEDLLDKPKFAEIADALAEFVEGAELVIHNAPFDLGFLNAEFALLERGDFKQATGCTSLDTLALAKELHPGKRNNLDALCERYEVANAHRSLHGALLDARLLADVYLAMTRGQDTLSIGLEHGASGDEAAVDLRKLALPTWLPDDAALAAHNAYLDALEKEIKGTALWRSAAPASAA
ncbi:MAG: DNA polymerase III subunit epsilon [Burkholderiaceae bacterium]